MKILIYINGKGIPHKPWEYHMYTYVLKAYDNLAKNCNLRSTGPTYSSQDEISTFMAYEAEGVSLNSEAVFGKILIEQLNLQYSKIMPTFENLDQLSSIIIFRIINKESKPSQSLTPEDKKQIENTNRFYYSSDYKTDLGKAAYFGKKELVLKMLGDESYNPGKTNNDALLSAVKGGHFEIVSLLCKDPRVIFNKTIDTEKCPVYHACIRGNLEIVQFLSELDPSIHENADRYLVFDIIHHTAKKNHLKIVYFLLQKEVIINQIIPDITRLIRCALGNNLSDFITMLLEFRPIRNLQNTILNELTCDEKIFFEKFIQKMHLNSHHLFRKGFFFDSQSSLNLLNKDIVDKISQSSQSVIFANSRNDAH